MRFSPHQIALAPAAGECTGHDDAALRRDARGWLALVADENLELMQQRRPDDRLLRVRDLLFVVREVGAGRGERRAADALIPVALVLVVRTDRDRDAVAVLMGDAERQQRLPVRLLDGVLDRARRADGEDERLLVLLLVVS